MEVSAHAEEKVGPRVKPEGDSAEFPESDSAEFLS
jgi:hypothetical protein